MNISKKEENGTTTLKIDGWLDVQTTPELHAYMEELPPSAELVFDFSGLEYISSAGVREVVIAYRRQQEAKGSFCVINVPPDVMDVLTMTGINRKINIIGAS